MSTKVVKAKRNKDIIVIARHGKPALSRKVRLTGPQFRLWWQQYDAGGLAEGQKSNAKTTRQAEKANIVFSSDLRRAVETANLLRQKPADQILPLFREAALPSPNLGPIKFRPKSWGAIARILWFFGYSSGMESVSLARTRALEAANLLQSEATGGRFVFLAAHGWFNRMIGSQLKRQGWKCTKNQGDLHWRFRRYERVSQIE